MVVDVLFLQNMTIVKLKGGLGNQMFQYAAGLAVAIHNEDSLLLDISNYKNQSIKDTPRSYELSAFTISYSQTTLIKENPVIALIKKIKNKISPPNPYTFDASVFASYILDGVFQNELYFADIREQILKEFTLRVESDKVQETKKYIKSITSVSIHIRRGDYVSNVHANAYHGILPVTYYKNAYQEIVKQIGSNFTLFVFTDDVEWANKNIKFHPQTFMMSTHSFGNAEELTLMSYCNHNIISNSSFSWWAAWLNQNPNKIVIAPQQWTAKNIENDIIPKTWKKI